MARWSMGHPNSLPRFSRIGWSHARIAVGVASLPRGVPVEIELTATIVDEGC